ncbi:PREDICTED: abhydrolase domain-containing protein 16A isoform X2 [Dufourea novaeangliae]|uniref:Abhydrolase domain-containing protein 16A n=1 Tax=Dufourea novaeangliae TaxID=178035 RepID=A0A154NYV6_DUFNO|nr:PREDICTED: abhydrolase domain-containing protein 16A isoform X2 [Dufourea novaeangliae]KZC04807.1 Abhydrolase domain-containing protein 16A [Dufourea novaeangliae]
MSLISTLWKCTFSPRLFKVYEITWTGQLVDKSYEPKVLERWGDQIVICFAAIWSISLYTIPLVATFFYQRSNPLLDNVYLLCKVVAGAGIILIASLAARGCSRANNPVYLKFLKTLHDATAHYNAETKQELQKYEFEFWAWPVDFKAAIAEGDKAHEKLTLEKIATSSGRIKRQTNKDFLITLPCKLLAYIVAHTFAMKMIYPGSASIINWAFRSTLLKGRISLIKQGGERYKLLTTDGNEIDTMFIDRRNKTTNGNILVITCEGNCGFYESGIISTPLKKRYSVLGWNHPGYGSSTGAPYPLQEENAIDCVMRFAIEHLRFTEEQIILYGWSIGGYTATWAAMNYPSVRSLVLDATFDDVLPLAIMTMSSSLEGLVRNIIRDYFNLHIAEQLNRYNGPVLLIRRTEDEVVCIPSNTLAGNRGNMLLTKVLIRRYPHLFLENSECGALLTRFLSADVSTRKSIIETVQVDEKQCPELIAKDIEKTGGIVNYPSTLGQGFDSKTKQQLILFLATVYMKDQPSTHCMPLAVDLFNPGWDPASTVTVK